MADTALTGLDQLARHASHLRVLAHHLVRGPDVDDVVQDTLVSALTATAPPRAIRPWLRQVLRNNVYAGVRREQRRRRRESAVAEPQTLESLDDCAAQAELIGVLRELLEELEEPYAEVLRARFYDGQSLTHIAEAQGCPAGTVRWRLHEGIRRIRTRLDERYESRKEWCGTFLAVLGLPPPPNSGSAVQGTISMKFAALMTGGAMLAAGGGTMAWLERGAELDAPAAHDGREHQRVAEEVTVTVSGRPPGAEPSLLASPDRRPDTTALFPAAAGGGGFDVSKLPHKGAPASTATVTMIECGEFDCRFCREINETVEDVLSEEESVAFFWLHFPMEHLHPSAKLRSQAAAVAHEHGKFWEMHDALLENPGLKTPEQLTVLAGQIGIDPVAFGAALEAPETVAEVDRQHALCESRGAQGVPAFFIDEELLQGVRPLDEMLAAVRHGELTEEPDECEPSEESEP